MKLTHALHQEQGAVVLFVMVLFATLLVFAGLAVDLAYQATASGEMQRSLDAAALAGAGKLGFDATAFPAVRAAAASYARLNTYRNTYGSPEGGIITLDQNPGNAPTGNIVLGVWAGGTFTPSVDGTVVNAVRCQWTTRIPTTFLRLLEGNFSFLAMSATSIAVSNPPTVLPRNACPMPVGVTACAFQSGGAFNSQGCGTVLSYVVGAPDNTAAWVDPSGGNPNASQLRSAINAVFNGTACGSGAALPAGSSIGAQNGVDEATFETLTNDFRSKFNGAQTYTVKGANGQTTYRGHGWRVFVPVIQSACPPAGPFNGSVPVLTYAQIVITQVMNKNRCAVTNNWPGNPWNAVCAADERPPRSAIWAYYDCERSTGNPPVTTPAPRVALATRVQLVR